MEKYERMVTQEYKNNTNKRAKSDHSKNEGL